MLILGEKTAKKLKESLASEVKKLKSKPCLAVIMVGNNPASEIYVSKKEKACTEIGMESRILKFDENISQQELEREIEKLNTDKNVNGILVQLPLPKKIKTEEILEKILPQKDVDGFHPINAGMLLQGLEPYAVPCTPMGIIKLLEDNNISIESKHALIIGRSNIVGKPLACLLLNRNATVTICHSKTENLKEIAKTADILVAAVGRTGFVTGDFVKEGAVVIDVGINRTPEGKVKGDVDFDSVEPKASYITPVPGGVGVMTIAVLLANTLELYKRQNC